MKSVCRNIKPIRNIELRYQTEFMIVAHITQFYQFLILPHFVHQFEIEKRTKMQNCCLNIIKTLSRWNFTQ